MTSATQRKLCFATALVALASQALVARADPTQPEPPASSPDPPVAVPLELTVDTACPAPEEIGAALRGMLGLSPRERLHEVARVAHTATTLVVTLRGADGAALGERALPLEGNCAELARAAAVVLASWLGDAHPEFVARLPPATPHASVTPPSPPTPRVVQSGSVRSSGIVIPKSDWRLRTAAAVGASLVPQPLELEGGLALAFVPARDGLGLSLRVSTEALRERAVPGGRVRYARSPLGLGALARLTQGSIAFELEAGGALGWLHVAGRSFDPDRSANDVTYGPFAAARLLAAHGRVQPFAEFAGVVWLPSARVYADTTQPSVALPAAELTLSLGAAFVL